MSTIAVCPIIKYCSPTLLLILGGVGVHGIKQCLIGNNWCIKCNPKLTTTNTTSMSARKWMSEIVFHLYHRKYLNMPHKNLRVPLLENLTILNNRIQASDNLSFYLTALCNTSFWGLKSLCSLCKDFWYVTHSHQPQSTYMCHTCDNQEVIKQPFLINNKFLQVTNEK